MSVKLGVRVAGLRELGGALRELTLVAAGDEPLPAFSAGSHIRIYMRVPEERCNAYSLVSPPWRTDAYRIVVRRAADGAGGSRHLHDGVGVGDLLAVDPPRNLFALPATGRRHVLVAGGVGLTPFVAYAHRLARAKIPFELHHVTADAAYGPLHEELRAVAREGVEIYGGRAELIAGVDAALARQPLGTHLSLCGPDTMMEAVAALAQERGWPASRIHSERFRAAAGPMEPFSVVLAGSGRRVAVDADKSMLEALERAGIEIPFLCRQGVCGECRTGLVDGEPDHRDIFLTADERAGGDHVMPCVSRCGRDGVLILRLLDIDQRYVDGDDATLPQEPFEWIVRQLQEDVELLDERGGELFLDAGILTFGADWSLDFDLGMSFLEIHGPVPRVHELGVIPRAHQFLLRLAPGPAYRRTNWTMTVDRRLDTCTEVYPEWGPARAELREDEIGERLHLRVEVQHLVRLPRSNAVMFPIHTYLASLDDLCAVPAWSRRLERVLAGLPQDLVDYKGLSRYRDAAVAWLADRNAHAVA